MVKIVEKLKGLVKRGKDDNEVKVVKKCCDEKECGCKGQCDCECGPFR